MLKHLKIGLIVCWSISQIPMIRAQSGNISGQVFFENSDVPVEFPSIHLLDSDKKIAGTGGDHRGIYQFQNVPVGTYKILIEIVEFPDTTVNLVRVFPDSTIQIKTIYKIPPCEYDKKSSKIICPVCMKYDQVVPIIYQRIPTGKNKELIEEGKAISGGCQMFWCSPNSYCKRDKHWF